MSAAQEAPPPEGTAIEPRLSLVTLGVRDIAVARAFYERLGWRASGASQAGVAFFQLGPLVLSLYGREDIARDAGLAPAGAGFAGISLAQNLDSPEAVDVAYAAALAAGATGLKPPHRMFWGGTCAFFADPDGYVWELAHNPGFTLRADGALVLPP